MGTEALGLAIEESILQESPAEDIAEGLWSAAVALDPRHRPQEWDRPSSTVRREWCRFPQEAHLVERRNGRYRRLTSSEMALLQGFQPDWFDVPGLTDRNRIRAIGDAVPPPLATAVIRGIGDVGGYTTKTSLEFCAGSGGLALGSAKTELRHLALVERWRPAVEILRHKKPWAPELVHEADVRQFDFRPFRGEVGVLSGGPPCQPWSLAGRREGFEDERDLLQHMPSLVAEVQPEAFVFENVPGLAAAENRAYLVDVLNRLRNVGNDLRYGVSAGVFLAADFGLAQMRRRLIIVGLRDRPSAHAYRALDTIRHLATHRDPTRPIPGHIPWPTLQDAVGHLRDPGGWRRWSYHVENLNA